MHCLTTALKKWESDGGSGIWSMLPETYWEAAAAELGLWIVYKNKGDINLLKSLEAVYGYKVYVLDAYSYGEEVVSSSRIREEISNGDLEEANKMLSREYFLEGKVIHGKKLGRQLGFPTANLEYNSNYVLPKTGVYYTNVLVNNEIYKGITSVGYNPTVSGDKKLTVETYILDFSEEIYDLQMKVYFIKRIRDEEKFNSMEELINQLKDDRNFVLRVADFFLGSRG